MKYNLFFIIIIVFVVLFGVIIFDQHDKVEAMYNRCIADGNKDYVCFNMIKNEN